MNLSSVWSIINQARIKQCVHLKDLALKSKVPLQVINNLERGIAGITEDELRSIADTLLLDYDSLIQGDTKPILRFFTIKEASDILGVPRDRLGDWILRNRIQIHRLTNRVDGNVFEDYRVDINEAREKLDTLLQEEQRFVSCETAASILKKSIYVFTAVEKEFKSFSMSTGDGNSHTLVLFDKEDLLAKKHVFDDFISIAQASYRNRVSSTTIRSWIRKGKIKTIRIFGKIHVNQNALRKYRHKVENKPKMKQVWIKLLPSTLESCERYATSHKLKSTAAAIRDLLSIALCQTS